MINSQKYTKLLITKNQKKKYQIPIVLSPRKLPKREKGTIPISWTIQRSKENTQQTQSQRKISDPNSALFLISQENQNQKKVEKKNEFPFPDNKSTKRNTHNKRNRKEKYQNLILTKT